MTGISGLLNCAAVFLFASVVGRWIDRSHRLRGYRCPSLGRRPDWKCVTALLSHTLSSYPSANHNHQSNRIYFHPFSGPAYPYVSQWVGGNLGDLPRLPSHMARHSRLGLEWSSHVDLHWSGVYPMRRLRARFFRHEDSSLQRLGGRNQRR